MISKWNTISAVVFCCRDSQPLLC